MNPIERHVKEFMYKYVQIYDVKEFLNDLDLKIDEYNEYGKKLKFLDYLNIRIKSDYDDHVKNCNLKNCNTDECYEDVLFFLQDRIHSYENLVDSSEISFEDRYNIKSVLDQILKDLQELKDGQEVLYDDLQEEFKSLQDHLHLKKKVWTELLIGKLTTMVFSGVISESISKRIVSYAYSNIDLLSSGQKLLE
jgi:hypothetical protein